MFVFPSQDTPSSYLSEGMLNDHLPVEIRYSWEQISDSCFSLGINLFLCLRQLPGICRSRVVLLTDLGSGLFDDRSSDMMAHAMNLQRELLDVFVVLAVGIVRSLELRWVVKKRKAEHRM